MAQPVPAAPRKILSDTNQSIPDEAVFHAEQSPNGEVILGWSWADDVRVGGVTLVLSAEQFKEMAQMTHEAVLAGVLPPVLAVVAAA